MKHLSFVSAAAAALLFVGCSVMHFQNGPVEPAGRYVEKWHHNLAYSLYEVSPPLDMRALCPEGDWSKVTTKRTFITVLAGGIDDALTSVILPPSGIDIWDPQMVEYTCGR
jgi:hypothetical protein